MTKHRILTLVVLTLVVLAGRTWAACEPQWLSGQAVPGADGTVYAMTSWDPDGPGGQVGLVVVGGSFSLAGNVAASNIACWDPVAQTWSALGVGVDNWVYALAVLDGKLYAGGYLTTGGGLACWDPSSQTWSAVGGGLSSSSSTYVTALTVLDGKLYVAGSFTTAGGVSANSIACWDPATSTWSAVGAPGIYIVTMTGLNGKLYASGSNSLYARGGPTVSCWDPATSTWSAIGTGVGGVDCPAVYALAALGDKLYVGGDFATAGGVSANKIASWDPATQTWSAVGSEDIPVRALAVGNGKLYAMHVASYGPIGSWDPATLTWTDLAPGPDGAIGYSAGALTVLDCKLYVGGDFTTAGGLNATGIACLDLVTSNWSALGSGIDGAALAMTALNGKVYVGGKFTIAGGVPVNRIACFDPVALFPWSSLGTGMDEAVLAMTALIGKLYAGGKFTSADGIAANKIACWDPATATWMALGTGIDGPYPEVAALAVLDSKLFVGGSFTSAGGVSANNIACWDPATSTWSALGTGMNDRVSSLVILDGKLYAGGYFTTAAGASASGIACWNPTTQTWSTVGTGLATGDAYVLPFVKAVTVLNGKLFVGGEFATAGGVSASRLACWDPTTSMWSALGSGVTEDVYALAALNGQLYVGGWFEAAGGLIANSIACWNPFTQAWSPLGTGMDECVHALAALDGTLYAGGYFATAGGQVSPYLAIAIGGCPQPSITAAVSRKNHGTAGSFEIDVSGSSTIESRMSGPTNVLVSFDKAIQRISGTLNDVQVSQGSVTSLAVNGATLDVGLSGAVGPQAVTLSFPGIAANDSGAVVSEAFCFRVLPGDASGDGIVDTSDYVAVRGRIGQAVDSTNCRCDINADGAINTSDFVAIRGRIDTTAGACP